jgi:formamidopyrimidine-DNA glycosylase
MPELPETETIARDLDAAVRGAVIAAVHVWRGDVLREADGRSLSVGLTGAAIERVWRRAKLVVLDLANGEMSSHLVVQPRFTGGLLLTPTSEATADRAAADYRTLSLTLADGRGLHYRDVRRLGTVALMTPERFSEYSAGLGPEPLDPALTVAAFSGFVRTSRQMIKVALMDQRRLAGVGNIYANEALWLAGIDPSRPSNTLTVSECGALLGALRDVLSRSIAERGTSFRDYRDAHGERGGFVAQLAAYGRGGHPCPRCGRRLVDTHAIDGRTTVFCPGCQR